jgi:hypothetical protein
MIAAAAAVSALYDANTVLQCRQDEQIIEVCNNIDSTCTVHRPIAIAVDHQSTPVHFCV